jgi:probable O-glycosylation ligase (exosortase A-associated)
MRRIILFVIFFIFLPYCFTRPWIGMLIYSWISYMNPHRYAWIEFPFAEIAAIAVLAGYLATKDKDKFHMERETVIILILWAWFVLTTFTAFNFSVALPMLEKTSKVLLMVLMTLPLINTKDKLRYLVLVIALSLGLLGLKGAVFSAITGGVHTVRGPDGSFIAGEGDFGLALNMTLPLLFFQARNESKKWMKILLYACFLGSIVSVIFTFRRGSFLALAVVIFLLLIKSNSKIIVGILVAAAIFSAPYWIPEKWFGRMDTIETYEEDYSAMGRINAWKMAWNIALDYPITGGGFETWKTVYRAKYMPYPGAIMAGDVHSIYFEMLQEQGFVGLGLFMALLFSVLTSMQRLKWKFRSIKSCSWISNYADMLQVSILAYMAGGVFLGRAYFDLFYQLVIISVILKVLARRELEKIDQSELPA